MRKIHWYHSNRITFRASMKSEEQIVLKPILPFCTDHTVLVMVRKQVKDRLWTDRLKKKLRNILCPAAVVRIKLNITKRSYIVNYIFRLVTSVGHRKNSESPWGIEPQTFGFRAPISMLYHWTTVTLRSARSENFFFVPRVTRQNTSFTISLPSSKLTIFLILSLVCI